MKTLWTTQIQPWLVVRFGKLPSASTGALAWAKKHWIISISVALISSCSFITRDRSVSWEEEVLLNTGETIWVRRTATYASMGGAGNPLDFQYRIKGSPTLDFEYNGKKYSFKEKAGLMVLAISPKKIPVLVMPASSGLWNVIHKYACTYPFYVQFEPAASGKDWSWPPQIETWLYDLPANLFRDFGKPDGMLTKYTRADKATQQYLNDPQLIHVHKIDPAHTGDLCKRKEK